MRGFPARTIARIGTYAVIVAAPWLYLGPAAIAVAVLSVGCAVCFAIASFDRQIRGEWRWTLPSSLAAAALFLTLLQLLPLPLSLQKTLSPGTAEILGASGAAPASLDPPATQLGAIQLAGVLFATLLAATVFRHRERRRELLAVLALYGACLTLIGVAELVLVHEDVPRYVTVAFENPNHFGAFVGLASFAAMSVALGLRDNKRWLFVAAAVLCLIGVLLSSSRGAIGAFLVTALGFGALTLWRWSTWVAARWVTPAVVASAALGGWLLWTTISQELAPDAAALTKLDVWRYSIPMLGDFAFLGIGRGAFPQAFTRYDLTGTQLRFTHVENAVLQTLVDYGPICGGLLVIGLLTCLARTLWAARRHADRSAAAFGLVFLALHNLVDFNTALLGVGLPAVLLLASHYRGRRSARREVSARLPAVALTSAGILALASAPAIRTRIAVDTIIVRELAAGAETERVDACIARHPADWVLPAIAAEGEIKRRDLKRALHHVNRAMLLAPYSDVPHRLAGRALLLAGRRDQARLEYRIAARKVPVEIQDIIAEMLTNGEPLGEIPRFAEGAPEIAFAVASVLMDRGAPTAALQALSEALQAQNVDTASLDMAARASLEGGDEALTLRLAERLETRDPKHATAYLVRSARAEARGELVAALAEIDRGIERGRASHELTRRRIGLLTKLGRYEDAHGAITWLLEHTRSEADSSSAHYYRGNLFMAEGRASEALTSYRKACELAPRELTYRLALAAAYERVGDRSGAIRDLEQARIELGDAAALTAELKRLRGLAP